MRRERIKNILEKGEARQEVTVCGWVRTKRVSKTCAFLALNDGSCHGTVQVVVDANSSEFAKLEQVGTGSSMKVKGKLVESPAEGQRVELVADNIEIFGHAGPEYPLQKKGHTLEFLREIAHLRPRTATFGAMFRLRNVLARSVHDFFQSRGFIWAHSPLITATDGEGAGEMFTVTNFNLEKLPRNDAGKVDFTKDFFGKHAHLCVTGQLEAEFMALSLGDVYTFGPTFRAENSNTSRHLAEFWMIEPEMAFADLNDNIALASDFFTFMLSAALKECAEELDFFEKFYKAIKVEDLLKNSQKKPARVTYTEAVEILRTSGRDFEYPVNWGTDLQSEHERFLCEQVFKGPVFVTDYPKDIKAFYMRLNDDEKTVAATDFLVPGVGELIGGSQREDRLPILESRLDGLGIVKDDLQWYLDLRRFGSVPHAGFGLGFERMLLYCTGIGNIRDTIPCPRAPGLIAF